MICPNCGCTNNDNAEVCSVCGTVLENEMQNSDSDNSKKKVIIALISVLAAVCVAAASVIAVTLHKKNQQYVAYPLVSDLSDEGLDNKDVTGDDLSDNINEDAEEIFDTQTTKEKSKTSHGSYKTEKSTIGDLTVQNKPTTTVQSTRNNSNTVKRTQYRYRDKNFTTSTSNSLSGWTKYDKKTSWSNYSSWSNWSTNTCSSSNSRQTETRTTYRYYVFRCTKCGNRDPYRTPCDNCKTSKYFVWEDMWYSTKGNSMNKHTLSTVPDKYYVIIGGKRWWFERDGYSDGQGGIGQPSRTEYRYRDRHQITTYYYYKWSNWSSWSTTPVSSSENRQVETRTV